MKTFSFPVFQDTARFPREALAMYHIWMYSSLFTSWSHCGVGACNWGSLPPLWSCPQQEHLAGEKSSARLSCQVLQNHLKETPPSENRASSRCLCLVFWCSGKPKAAELTGGKPAFSTGSWRAASVLPV